MRAWLAVPFRHNARVKALGARFDGERRQWYAPERADLALFREWLPADLARWLGSAFPPDPAAQGPHWRPIAKSRSTKKPRGRRGRKLNRSTDRRVTGGAVPPTPAHLADTPPWEG